MVAPEPAPYIDVSADSVAEFIDTIGHHLQRLHASIGHVVEMHSDIGRVIDGSRD